MKLSEFLSLTRLTSTEIAKEIGIAPQTIWNALKGYEMSLTNALKIEEYTKKAVTCNDLKPTRKRGKQKEVNQKKSEKPIWFPDHPLFKVVESKGKAYVEKIYGDKNLSKDMVDHKGDNSCQTHDKSTPE